jgi:hypothetical protein
VYLYKTRYAPDIKIKSEYEPHQDKTNSAFATSMDPDQPAHPPSVIRIHVVRLPTLLQVEKLIVNSMNPDQTVQMCRLVWIYAGGKRTMLVLS